MYRNAERRPGPTYYRAAYACGLSRRIGADAPAQHRAGKAFEIATQKCEQAHALKGQRSFPNDGLKTCLAKAVDDIAPAVQP